MMTKEEDYQLSKETKYLEYNDITGEMMHKAIFGHEQQTTNNKIIFTVRSFSISHGGPSLV